MLFSLKGPMTGDSRVWEKFYLRNAKRALDIGT